MQPTQTQAAFDELLSYAGDTITIDGTEYLAITSPLASDSVMVQAGYDIKDTVKVSVSKTDFAEPIATNTQFTLFGDTYRIQGKGITEDEVSYNYVAKK